MNLHIINIIACSQDEKNIFEFNGILSIFTTYGLLSLLALIVFIVLWNWKTFTIMLYIDATLTI